MNDLRPQKAGWKQLKKMKKKELLDEIKRLDEVVQITARRFNTLERSEDIPKSAWGFVTVEEGETCMTLWRFLLVEPYGGHRAIHELEDGMRVGRPAGVSE
jgi:hypothetical protein